MGWTSKAARHYKDGQVDRKQECDDLYTCQETEQYDGCNVVKSVMYGTKYYAVVAFTNTKKGYYIRRPVVVLTSVECKSSYAEFAYKDIYSPELPKNLLELLPNDNYNIQYKLECLEEKKKEIAKNKENIGKKQLSKLPVGTIIEFETYSHKLVRLIKRDPDYQFKTTWWQIYGESKYYSKRYIPEKYTIIREGY